MCPSDCKQPCDQSMCQMLMIYLMLEVLLRYYITFMKLQIIKNDHLGAPFAFASFKSIVGKKSQSSFMQFYNSVERTWLLRINLIGA